MTDYTPNATELAILATLRDQTLTKKDLAPETPVQYKRVCTLVNRLQDHALVSSSVTLSETDSLQIQFSSTPAGEQLLGEYEICADPDCLAVKPVASDRHIHEFVTAQQQYAGGG